MASTSTNKQPLLIDRPLHIQQNITSQKTGVADGDANPYWLSNNSCSLFIDCTQNDGALIEDLYVLSKSTTAYTLLFFMTNTSDFLRESDTNNVTYLAGVTSSTTVGSIVHANNLPLGIAPYPTVALNDDNDRQSGQFQSLYVPKGKAVWVGRQASGTGNLTIAQCPVVGAQGGFY